MKKALMTLMTTSISEVMETMFFLPVEIGPKIDFEKSGIGKNNPIACQLAFSGETSGSLLIISPENLTAEMAGNFMGEDQSKLTREHLVGTLTEMLNMVCGNALGKTNAKTPYALGIPEPVSCTALDDKDEFTLIETIGYRMVVSLIVEEG